MEPTKSIEELTRRNVAIIAEMEKAESQVRTPGDRLAEWLASLVGSWTFLIVQTLILLAWLTLNLVMWIQHWDPYPFVLLISLWIARSCCTRDSSLWAGQSGRLGSSGAGPRSDCVNKHLVRLGSRQF